MVIAKAARDRRTSTQVVLNERTDHFALEALLVIDHVVGNPDGPRDSPRVVNVIQGTTPALHGFRHAFVSGKTTLVPELHRQPDDGMALRAQHGRDGRRINPAGHGYGYGLQRHPFSVFRLKAL